MFSARAPIHQLKNAKKLSNKGSKQIKLWFLVVNWCSDLFRARWSFTTFQNALFDASLFWVQKGHNMRCINQPNSWQRSKILSGEKKKVTRKYKFGCVIFFIFYIDLLSFQLSCNFWNFGFLLFWQYFRKHSKTKHPWLPPNILLPSSAAGVCFVFKVKVFLDTWFLCYLRKQTCCVSTQYFGTFPHSEAVTTTFTAHASKLMVETMKLRCNIGGNSPSKAAKLINCWALLPLSIELYLWVPHA